MSKRVIVYGTATEQALVRTIEELKRENAALREELEYAIKAGAKREADLLVMLGKEPQP